MSFQVKSQKMQDYE